MSSIICCLMGGGGYEILEEIVDIMFVGNDWNGVEEFVEVRFGGFVVIDVGDWG